MSFGQQKEWPRQRPKRDPELRVAIHQPQYLPYLGFFHKLNHCDIFVSLDNVQFQKNSHQNRNKIKTCTGWQWLTVPVLHRADQTMAEVQINPKVNWSRKHWNALLTNYSSAPYFKLYKDEVRDILERGHSQLDSLNMALLSWAAGALGIETPIRLSSELGAGEGKTQRLVELCLALGADTYLSGAGGRLYMETERFEQAGINVEYQSFQAPTYRQQFPEQGFLANLSVVDALFCCGPRAAEFVN